MLSSKSLRVNFLLKLSAAMAALVLLFSIILYSYIDYSVNREIQSSLKKQASYLFANYTNLPSALKEQKDILEKTLKIHAKIAPAPFVHYKPNYMQIIKDSGHYYQQAFFPYNFSKQTYLILTADITDQKMVEKKVFRAIITIDVIGMLIILFYAYFLSQMLISPIKYFSLKLTKMNENALQPLDLDKVPLEFKQLGRSINQLINKIQNFLHYKKELFVGTAHELKTPLAVMKTKNQVTMLKRNTSEESLREALKQNITSIDHMNKVIESILEFGRAEGAQFEEAVDVDIIELLKTIAKEFQLLAGIEHKTISYTLSPDRLTVKLQILLFRQIIQNLLQNAIRFTPENGRIKISSFIKDNNFLIKIRDEGPGIPDNIDLFAPFKRSKNSPGTGLGLFLVKSAADALGASVELHNRKEGQGTVATIILHL